MNENREVADCRSRLSHPGRGPAELASQNTTDLIEDCTSTTEAEYLIGHAGEIQRGDVDVGVGNNPRHATGRDETPGRRARRPPVSCRLSGPGRRRSAGAYASVAPGCSGAAPPGGPLSWCGLPGQAFRFSDQVRGKRERADSCGG